MDIDTQAVEVTKLSLLLKCMEGETASSINAEMRFGERVLPTLDQNIKSGNSLIDLDFYDGEMDFEPGAEKKIKPFSWEKAFPAVFKNGGFDAVVGNPPYGAVLKQSEDRYLRNYSVANYQLDTYVLFIEKGNQLLKQKGLIGYIIPSAWVASTFDVKLRSFLSSKMKLESVIVCPQRTFKDASVETCIVIASKDSPKQAFSVERWDVAEKQSYKINLEDINSNINLVFPIYANPIALSLIQKIRAKNQNLSELADVVWGVKIYEKSKGIPAQNGTESDFKSFHSPIKTKKTHRPLLGGSEINRYRLNWKGGYVDYGKWLAAPRSPIWFEGERIVVREVTAGGVIQGTLIQDDFVFSNSVDGIRLITNDISIKFLLGLINSKLISYYHLNTSANAFKGTFPKLLLQDLRALPIPIITSTNKIIHNDITALVDLMLSLNALKAGTTLSETREALEHRIAHTDAKINALVYQLYGLTAEEIAIVESA